MLLALIVMTTFTLGLLFSGWLTPTTGKAQPNQPNPPPNQETTNCIENGPTTNVLANCGSVIDNGTLTNTDLCVQQGGTLPYPDWLVEPTISSGAVVYTTTYDCTNTVTQTTNIVTYTFSSFGFDPPEPDPAHASVGDHTCQCSVTAFPSDTNCSDINIHCGSVTWHVVSTNLIETILGFDGGSQWQPCLVGFVGEPAGGASGYQFDGFSVNYSATVDVLCTRGCSSSSTSGTRTSSYTSDETIEVYKAGQGDLDLPHELLDAIGTLAANEIDDNIPLYGVDPRYLSDIVNAIHNNTPSSLNPGAGQWKDGKSPCSN